MVTTISDVAKHLGIAKSTVSNALTGKKYVSDELKQKILDTCKAMDYEPNFYAASLSTRKTNIIALLLEERNDNEFYTFYTELIISSLKEAANLDYNLLVYYHVERQKLITTLRPGKAPIDGAIILSPCMDDERIRQIEHSRIPCMIIGRPGNDLNLNYVDVNNKQLTYDVVDRLYQKGYSIIYLINSSEQLTISYDRSLGFIERIKEIDLSMMNNMFYTNSTTDEGYEIAKKKVQKNVAFIVANEHLAKGVYQAVKEEHLEVGKDVGVFSLGGTEKRNFHPSLSYAKQDYNEIGSIAVHTLIQSINQEQVEASQFVNSMIVENHSTSRQ